MSSKIVSHKNTCGVRSARREQQYPLEVEDPNELTLHLGAKVQDCMNQPWLTTIDCPVMTGLLAATKNRTASATSSVVVN